jgi:hypothetical protein
MRSENSSPPEERASKPKKRNKVLHQSRVTDVQRKKNEKPAAQQLQDKPRQPIQSVKNTSLNKPKNEPNNAPKEQRSSKK